MTRENNIHYELGQIKGTLDSLVNTQHKDSQSLRTTLADFDARLRTVETNSTGVKPALAELDQRMQAQEKKMYVISGITSAIVSVGTAIATAFLINKLKS